MKAKLLYAMLTASTAVGFVVYQVGSAGSGHVDVVVENNGLKNENTSLKKENTELKEENASLDSLNSALISDKFSGEDSLRLVDAFESKIEEKISAKYQNQISTLQDENQRLKDDLSDLDAAGRRIPLGPIK
jgi:cell shape-determining protein MreC